MKSDILGPVDYQSFFVGPFFEITFSMKNDSNVIPYFLLVNMLCFKDAHFIVKLCVLPPMNFMYTDE